MFLETFSVDLAKVRLVNQTSNGYVAKVPTKTEPAGDANSATGTAVIDTGNGGTFSQNSILLRPYGAGANNATFSFRVLGWAPIWDANHSVTTKMWIPILLAEFTVTLSSNIPGLAGGAILSTELFADTIVSVQGTQGIDFDILSPADDASLGHVMVDMKGARKIEVSFTTGGSATDCNALYTLL